MMMYLVNVVMQFMFILASTLIVAEPTNGLVVKKSVMYPVNYAGSGVFKQGDCRYDDLPKHMDFIGLARSPEEHYCYDHGGIIFHLSSTTNSMSCSFELKCDPGKYLAKNGTCTMKAEDCYYQNSDCHYPKHLNLPAGNCNEDIWSANAPSYCAIGEWKDSCSNVAHVVRLAYVILQGGKKRYLSTLNLQTSQEGSIVDSYYIDTQVRDTKGVIGTEAYCKTHNMQKESCYRRSSDGVAEYRIDIPTRLRNYVQLDGCTEPVYCYGFEEVSVYGYKTETSPESCGDCSATCSDKVIHMTSDKYKNGQIEICSRSQCVMKKQGGSVTEVTRDYASKIYDEGVKLILFDDQKNVVWEKSIPCPQVSICDAIDCWLCKAKWLNVKCYGFLEYFLIILTFYLVVCMIGSFLAGMKPIIQLMSIILKTSFKIIKKFIYAVSGRAKTTSEYVVRYANDEESQIFRETTTPLIKTKSKFKPLPPFRGALLIVLILIPVVLCKGPCSSVTLNTYEAQDCKESGSKLTCSSSKVTIVPIVSYDQISCMSVVSPDGRVMAQLQITPMSIEYKCMKETWYHTRDFEIVVDHVMRCPGAAYCTDDWCMKVDQNTDIPDLPKPTGPYMRFCKLGSACAGRGCFYCTNSCHSIQYYARPRSASTYEIFACPLWKPSGTFHFLWESDSGKFETTLSLVHGETTRVNDKITVTLDITVESKMPVLSRQFISDGNQIAITKSSYKGQPTVGQIGQVQCQSESVANRVYGCTLAPQMCSCRPEGSNSGCDCSQIFLDKVFDAQSKLPLNIDGNFISKNSRGDVTLKTAAYGSGKIMVKADLNLIGVSSKPEECSIKVISIDGCYSCLTGATLKYQCTSAKPTTAMLKCEPEGIHMILECEKESTTKTARFQSTSPVIDISCQAVCQKGAVVLKGILAHVGLVPISNSSHISLAPSASLKSPLSWLSEFWSSLGWYSTLVILGLILLLFLAGFILVKYFHIVQMKKYVKIN